MYLIIKDTVGFQCTHALILGHLIVFWGVIVHKEGARSQQVRICMSTALVGDKKLDISAPDTRQEFVSPICCSVGFHKESWSYLSSGYDL